MPEYDLTRTMPNGDLLGYRDEDHSYWLAGKRIAACSTLVGTLNKFNLTRRGGWIERETAIGTYTAAKQGELDDVPPEDLWERVRMLGYGCGKTDQAADRGKITHNVMEGIAETGTVPNPAEVPEIARGWVRGAVAAWRALDVSEVVEREQIVCHPELGFAGRFDLLAITRSPLTGEKVLSLLDYKSSDKGTVWSEAHWQTRLYALAIRESMGLTVERIVIVGIGNDGGFELVECECTEDEARALALVYATQKKIGRQMSAQRRVMKAALAA
jgi:hypothetical protein